jgi:pimeloyl-ACP methyl ester carboxylesterase
VTVDWAERIELGGVRQWVLARGQRADNPVLLVLAGGPGGTATGWFRKHNAALEKRFTVVHWEQRGAGMSFPLLFTDRRRMTPEQYIQDGLQLTEHIRARFGQQKIYLLGHSWGSFLGVWMLQRRPDLFAAYVGVGQMVCPAKNDRMQYDWTLERARQKSEAAVVRRLERNGPPPYAGGMVRVAKKYADITLPNFRYMSAELMAAGGRPGGGDIKSMTDVEEYRLRDKAYAPLGVALTFGKVYPQLYGVDLATEAAELGAPVYFAEGRYDKNAMPSLVEQYFERLRAPEKALVWFERSGHDPCFEEPEKFQSLLIDKVLSEARNGQV